MEFAKALFAPALGTLPGDCVIPFVHLRRNGAPATEHCLLRDLGSFSPTQRKGWGLYMGTALRVPHLEPSKKGGRKDVIAVLCLSLDIDFFDPEFPGAHKATNLPRTMEDVAWILEGYPSVSAVVHTGNGVQCHWFFDEPIITDSESRRKAALKMSGSFQTPIIERAKIRGWLVDPTAGIQRIWRLPGFLNQKTNKPTSLLYLDEKARYTPKELSVEMPTRREGEIRLEDKTEPVAGFVPKETDLEVVREAMVRVSPKNQYYDSIQAALRGESMAEEMRERALHGVCTTIAFLHETHGMAPDELAEVLRPSLEVWAGEDGAKLDIDEELAKATDRIRRSQVDYLEKRAQESKKYEGLRKAFGVGEGKQADPVVDAAFLKRHAIIAYGRSYYVFDFSKGEYLDPVSRELIVPKARDAWESEITPPGVSLTYTNEKGESKTKTVGRIIEDHCTVASLVVGSMSVDQNWFDPTSGVLYCVEAPKRVTDAAYSSSVDEWLKHLVGFENLDKILDWLAGVPQLDKQCCALYLSGPSGAGKSLLSNAIARIWTTTPTKFDTLAGSFNSSILRCPLIRIEEGVAGAARKDMSIRIRELVGASSFEINEKYQVPRSVHGAVRLIICANNDSVISFNEEGMTVDDLDAVSRRILHMTVREEAREWLHQHSDAGRLTQRWVEGDVIAKHVIWLSENRRVIPGKRLFVEGNETSFHLQLFYGNKTYLPVYEFVARLVTDYNLAQRHYRSVVSEGGVRNCLVHKGDVLVNPQGIIDCWNVYMSHTKGVPSVGILKSALNQMSSGKRQEIKRGDHRVQYYKLRLDFIREWIDGNVGNRDKMEDNLNRSLKDFVSVA